MNTKSTKNVVPAILLLAILAASGCASQRAGLRKTPAEETVLQKKVYFDFGRKNIRSEDQGLLKEIAEKLRADPKSIAILEGHADPIGPSRSNEILAEERARTVRVFLRDQKVGTQQMTMVSKGEREIEVKSRTRKGNAPNRRVVVTVTLTKPK